MDHWMHARARRYAKHTHPNKPWKWRLQRYWGKLNPDRNDQGVFGNKHTGHYLLKFGWFKIVRHPLVQGRASPHDPSLRDYFWSRRKVNLRRLTDGDVRLAE